jgi:hypothetical protein
MPSQSNPAVESRISSIMQRYAPLPLRAIVGGGFIQHGWAKIIKGPEAFAAILQAPARSLPASVGVPHDFGGVAGRSSASFRRVYRMGKRADDRSPANRPVHGPSTLRLQLHQNQSHRGWSSAIRTSRIRMRPALYRVHPGSRVLQPRPVVH